LGAKSYNEFSCINVVMEVEYGNYALGDSLPLFLEFPWYVWIGNLRTGILMCDIPFVYLITL